VECISNSKLEEIIDLILEYVDVEVNIGCYTDAEPDFETFPYLEDKDRELVKEKIKEILNE